VPSLTNRTYLYVHGRGGYYSTPAGGRQYVVTAPLPPKPSAAAELRLEVLEVPFGGPRPELTALSESLVRIVCPLQERPASPEFQYGAIIAAGWRETTPSQRYRRLRVTFDSIKIHNDHDRVFSGEWRLWVAVNGTWLDLAGPGSPLNHIDDGDEMRFESKTVVTTILETRTLRIRTSGWESDAIDGYFGVRKTPLTMDLRDVLALDNNDQIGIVDKTYSVANNFGIGTHNDASDQNGDARDTRADFELRYHIEAIAVDRPEAIA
jgi:hypothetical protein